MKKLNLPLSLFLFSLSASSAFGNVNNHIFNMRDNSPLTNPDGTLVKYCEPYIIVTNLKMRSLNTGIFDRNANYYTFSYNIFSENYDYVYPTNDKNKAKVLTIEPKEGSYHYCHENKLVSSLAGVTLNESTIIPNNENVIIKFKEPNHPGYHYLTKSYYKYYFLNNTVAHINIGDLQTKSIIQYADIWTTERYFLERSKNKDRKRIYFLSAR